VKTATGKFGVFSKAFAQLSDESQDKLVKAAHDLLETHKSVKCKSVKIKEQIADSKYQRKR